MQSVQVIGEITTLQGNYFYTKRINTRVGKSFLSSVFGDRKDLFIGTPARPCFVHERGVIIPSLEVYDPLSVIEPVGSYTVLVFPQPREILVESE